MNPLLEDAGFSFIAKVVPPAEREHLIVSLGLANGAGRRGVLNVPAVGQLASSTRLVGLVRSHLPSEPIAVRAIYFDKSPDVNWLVAWHQDLTLAVRRRVEVPGFGRWSTKNGVPHVQPPIELLEKMLTVRLHLDDCDEENGALRVIPGTHRLGRLYVGRIQELRRQHPEFVCRHCAGDALFMRPLLLHASGRSQSRRHRRVLHIEFAGFTLPPPLEWCTAA